MLSPGFASDKIDKASALLVKNLPIGPFASKFLFFSELCKLNQMILVI